MENRRNRLNKNFTLCMKDNDRLQAEIQGLAEVRALKEGLCEAIMCPICLEDMKDPKLLPCGHSFCEQCVTQWTNMKKECPQCAQAVTADTLPVNYALRNVVDVLGKAASSTPVTQ
ncbi:hypothetical protein VNI00_017736 [Paramarasmius palmivorus]|uniref:RING-type domain-containing protein n=1 Tax=Paramarasmius palmivorus TaxID=297713 RepID=A0AAW0B3N9_9AGAR